MDPTLAELAQDELIAGHGGAAALLNVEPTLLA